MESNGTGRVTYIVLRKPPLESKSVKKGWSWPGFFFSWAWALAKRQWGLAGLCWIWMLLIIAVGKLLDATSAIWSGVVAGIFLILVPGLLVGAFGNQWLLETLCQLGYRIVEEEPSGGRVTRQPASATQ